MNYAEAMEYIHNTLKFGIKLGLHNMQILLDLMGNPHRKLRFVHVAGTNGKGSTVAYISNILIESGYRVGIYTSPYIERFTERIKINGQEIGESELGRLADFVKEKVEVMLEKGENHPTEFEIVTAIAFQFFLENSCDVVVLEVGLGGRHDSTNIIGTPELSVITTISYDHMDRLGNTLEEIAFEKAGIIKESGNVVIHPQTDSVERVFCNICREKGAKLHKADFTQLRVIEFGIDGQKFDCDGYKSLEISLLGEHQVRNACVAIKACEILQGKGFKITDETIRKGLKSTRWPGRMEVVNRNPLFIIDGAHNAEGAKALSNALNQYFPDKRKIFIIGVLKDKDYKSIIESVAPISYKIVAVTPNSDRALPAEELAIVLKSYCNSVLINDTIKDAVNTCMQISTTNDLICAFGSLYFIGEIRKIFKL